MTDTPGQKMVMEHPLVMGPPIMSTGESGVSSGRPQQSLDMYSQNMYQPDFSTPAPGFYPGAGPIMVPMASSSDGLHSGGEMIQGLPVQMMNGHNGPVMMQMQPGPMMGHHMVPLSTVPAPAQQQKGFMNRSSNGNVPLNEEPKVGGKPLYENLQPVPMAHPSTNHNSGNAIMIQPGNIQRPYIPPNVPQPQLVSMAPQRMPKFAPVPAYQQSSASSMDFQSRQPPYEFNKEFDLLHGNDRPVTLDDAVSLYITHLINENERIVKIYDSATPARPVNWANERYARDVLRAAAKFPTPKFRSFLARFNIEIEVNYEDDENEERKVSSSSACQLPGMAGDGIQSAKPSGLITQSQFEQNDNSMESDISLPGHATYALGPEMQTSQINSAEILQKEKVLPTVDDARRNKSDQSSITFIEDTSTGVTQVLYVDEQEKSVSKDSVKRAREEDDECEPEEAIPEYLLKRVKRDDDTSKSGASNFSANLSNPTGNNSKKPSLSSPGNNGVASAQNDIIADAFRLSVDSPSPNLMRPITTPKQMKSNSEDLLKGKEMDGDNEKK